MFTWANHVFSLNVSWCHLHMKVSSFWRLNTDRPSLPPRTRGCQGECILPQHNRLISKRHLPSATSYFVSSPLTSFHALMFHRWASFSFFSPHCFSQAGRPEWRFESDILFVLNSLWPGHRRLPVFFFQDLSNTCNKDPSRNRGPVGNYRALSYVKACFHMRWRAVFFVCNTGRCCCRCNLSCKHDNREAMRCDGLARKLAVVKSAEFRRWWISKLQTPVLETSISGGAGLKGWRCWHHDCEYIQHSR